LKIVVSFIYYLWSCIFSSITRYRCTTCNISIPNLIEFAVNRGEGYLSDKGVLVINTGKYTGRSPKDRFIVKDDITKDTINWGEVKLPIDEQVFDKIYSDVT